MKPTIKPKPNTTKPYPILVFFVVIHNDFTNLGCLFRASYFFIMVYIIQTITWTAIEVGIKEPILPADLYMFPGLFWIIRTIGLTYAPYSDFYFGVAYPLLKFFRCHLLSL